VRTEFETDDQDELLPKQSDADAAKAAYAKIAHVDEYSTRRWNWQKVKVPDWFVQYSESPMLLYLTLWARYGDLSNPRNARKALRSLRNMKLKWTDPTKSLPDENNSPAVRQDLHRVDKPSARRQRELDAADENLARLRQFLQPDSGECPAGLHPELWIGNTSSMLQKLISACREMLEKEARHAPKSQQVDWSKEQEEEDSKEWSYEDVYNELVEKASKNPRKK
jgi:hypothetical protein